MNDDVISEELRNVQRTIEISTGTMQRIGKYKGGTLDEMINNCLNSNSELKKENEELKKWNGKKQNYINALRKENDELKAKLVTVETQLVDMSENYSNACMREHELKHINDENKELEEEQYEHADLTLNEIKGLGSENMKLKEENEELKQSLRTITAMDKEEPWEQVEMLLNDVKTLTEEKCKLEDEKEAVQEELLIQKQRMAMLSASFAMLEYQKNVLEGEVKQANIVLKMLFK